MNWWSLHSGECNVMKSWMDESILTSGVSWSLLFLNSLLTLGTLRNGLLKSIYNLWDSIKTIAQTKLAGLWWTTWWRLSAEKSKCFIFSGSFSTRPGPHPAKVPKFIGKWWFFWLVLYSKCGMVVSINSLAPHNQWFSFFSQVGWPSTCT